MPGDAGGELPLAVTAPRRDVWVRLPGGLAPACRRALADPAARARLEVAVALAAALGLALALRPRCPHYVRGAVDVTLAAALLYPCVAGALPGASPPRGSRRSRRRDAELLA